MYFAISVSNSFHNWQQICWDYWVVFSISWPVGFLVAGWLLQQSSVTQHQSMWQPSHSPYFASKLLFYKTNLNCTWCFFAFWSRKWNLPIFSSYQLSLALFSVIPASNFRGCMHFVVWLHNRWRLYVTSQRFFCNWFPQQETAC
jgi:hypothetical protein